MGASDFSKLPHIGESLKRKEDYRFLTGAGQYTDDIVLANQCHAVFVRSPHAHAKINSIPDPRFDPANLTDEQRQRYAKYKSQPNTP